MSATERAYTEDNDTPGASQDTPITRAEILSMQLDELDAHLQTIRERRLRRVQEMATIAAVSTARATIDERSKLEKALNRASMLMNKMEVAEQAVAEAINKARLIALLIQ